MMVSNWSALARACRAKSRCSSLRAVEVSRSIMPTMPFIGVRISWLTLVRNCVLSRAASSAASLAFPSSDSNSIRSVMSRNITRASTERPSMTFGCTVPSTLMRFPVEVMKTVSTVFGSPEAMTSPKAMRKSSRAPGSTTSASGLLTRSSRRILRASRTA